jgi:hypothetical protein
MDRLDVATALAIRERLGARDLARSCAVCREFNALANDDTLWRGLSSREPHALVGADELPASSTSCDHAGSVAKRLYLCNRGWVDGEVRRDGSCHTRDDAFVEAAFADSSDGAPGASPRQLAAFADENAAKRDTFSLRAVRGTGAVLDRPDECGHSVTRVELSEERRRESAARATCATFLDQRNPDVAVSGFADGTLRASRVSFGTRAAPLEFAQKCGGRVRALIALDGAFEMEGEDARAIVVSVDELRRASSGARGVLLAARVPSALSVPGDSAPDELEGDDASGCVGTLRTRASLERRDARNLPVSFGGWCATRDATTALRRGDASSGGGLFAGTAGGSVEAFDLGSGQPRCVASFVGQCACPVGDVATCGVGSRLVVATYAHEARGTGHARGCMAFDVRAGCRVAAVDLPRRYGALGRAGSFFKTNRSASGPPLLASGSVSEPACALHADANKVVLGSPEGFAHVVDPRVWTVLSSFDLNVSGDNAERVPTASVSLLRARGERVAAQIDAPRGGGRLVTLEVGAARR